MKPLINNKSSFISKGSDIELFIDVHSKKLEVKSNSQDVDLKNEMAICDENSASKNKLLSGICFITDMNGFFRFIHPNLLKLLEGAGNKFFEKSIFIFLV